MHLVICQVRSGIQEREQFTIVLVTLSNDPSNRITRSIRAQFIGPSSWWFALQPSVGCLKRSRFIWHTQLVMLHHQVFQLLNSFELFLIRWKNRPRLQKSSERFSNAGVFWPTMRSDVVHCTKELLQLFQGVNGRPFLYGSHYGRVRRSPRSPNNFTNEFSFQLS